MSETTTLIPSATTILLTPGNNGFEVLLLKRNSKISIHGGSWVFPGGKCDYTDCKDPLELDNFSQLTKERQLDIAKQAACREALEEASVNPPISSLTLCSNWITPPTMSKRFNAFFFIAEYKSRYVKVDQGEIRDYRWISPKMALQKQEHKELTLPPPTYVTLLQLSKHSTINSAIHDLTTPPTTYRPKLITTNKGFHSVYEEDSGYQKEELKLTPPVHRLVVDDGKFEYHCEY